MKRKKGVSGFALLLSAAVATAAPAQQGAGVPHQQVISANPFGLLLELFNAEYERIVSRSSTAGLGGSFISDDGEDYANADVFWRFYPSEKPLEGWAFGVKVGITNVSALSENEASEGTYLGYGFDVNRSWLLGPNDNFYTGVGFGLKRLIGVSDELALEVIPTIRIVNIGIAF